MDAFDVRLLPEESLVIFVTSTTGQVLTPVILKRRQLSALKPPGVHQGCKLWGSHAQGELPSNMKQSWRFLLRKNLPADSLAGLAHAVFGLGDSGSVPFVCVSLCRHKCEIGCALFKLMRTCICKWCQTR